MNIVVCILLVGVLLWVVMIKALSVKSWCSPGITRLDAVILGVYSVALLSAIICYLISADSVETVSKNYLLKSADSVSHSRCKIVYVDEYNKEHTDIVEKANVRLKAKSDLSQHIAKRTKSEATEGPFKLRKIKWVVQSEEMYQNILED